MLNELFQVAEAIKDLGLAGKEAHPSMKPMGKSPVLIARLDGVGKIGSVDILMPDQAILLKRIEHGAAGTSFPGFNLPSPVWDLWDVPSEKLKQLVEVQKNRKATAKQRFEALQSLMTAAKQRSFTAKQEQQFNRIFGEFVTVLTSDFAQATPELEAFAKLLGILGKHPPTMTDFVANLVGHVTRTSAESDLSLIKTVEGFLIGKLVFKGVETVGSPEWWQSKKKEDKKNGKMAVYLDLDPLPASATAVAHQTTCDRIEAHLLKVRPGRGYAKGGKGARAKEGIDAFTGENGELTTSFPEPRVQALRPPDLKLFSASSESPCSGRYGLIESAIFPVSKVQSARMQNAILKLAAKKDQRGKTWYPIPSNLNEKKKPKTDLLVAYLENKPDLQAAIAEMFGGQCETLSDADFQARTQPVLEAIEATLKTTPDLSVRLLVLSSIDRGRKQISLNRRLRVVDVVRSAKDWQAGARDMPDVSVGLYNINTKQPVSRASPCPIDLASTVNRVWSADAKDGFRYSFQRAISVSDAYDIFLADSLVAREKAEFALGLLIRRMSLVLARLGAVKTTGNWKGLSDAVRWQSLKAVAFLGVFLRQLEQHKEDLMKEPVYQLGQLLALADSLHQQYCKHVRGGEAPTQLIGNSLFNTALEQPVFALARLAERMAPYQAWAKTFKNTDPTVKSGWEKTLLRLLRDCASRFIEDVNGVFRIRADELPARMTDLDKAKLLLGYLADIQESKTEDK